MTSHEPSRQDEAKERTRAKSSPRKTVYVLNGSNLDLVGEREPELYGRETLAAIEEKCSKTAKGLGIEIVFRQTNEEGTLVDWIHEARVKAMGIVINAAAYAHTSIAAMDALEMCKIPIFEVHITNVFRREGFRHEEFVNRVA